MVHIKYVECGNMIVDFGNVKTVEYALAEFKLFTRNKVFDPTEMGFKR